MAGIGATVALIKALAPKADPAVIQQAVEDYLEAHPEISVADGSITEEKLAEDVAGILDDLQDDVSDVKSGIQGTDNAIDLISNKSVDLSNASQHFYIDGSGVKNNSSNWNAIVLDDLRGIKKLVGKLGTNNSDFYVIAFYSSKIVVNNAFISGVKIATSGDTAEAIVPANAVCAVICTRPASYSNYSAYVVYGANGVNDKVDSYMPVIDAFTDYTDGAHLPVQFEQGSLTSDHGRETDSTKRIRNVGYISREIFNYLKCDNNHRIWFYEYAEANDTSFIAAESVSTSSRTKLKRSELRDETKYVRVVIVNTNSETTIAPTDNTGFACVADMVVYKIAQSAVNTVNKVETDMLVEDLGAYPRKKFIIQNIAIGSDYTIVGNKFVKFNDGSDDLQTPGNFAYREYDNGFDKAPTSDAKSIYHYFGHCNTVDYCAENGCLILGNGSGSYTLPGKIYIIPDFETLIENASQHDEFTLANTNAIVIDCEDYNLGTKFNVIWGENNGTDYNIAYLLTATYGKTTSDPDAGDLGIIRKLLLGMGDNELTYGQFVSGKSSTEFNGTFEIIETFTQEGTAYKDCCQGACYVNGEIVSAIGHDDMILWRMNVCNGKIKRKVYKQRVYAKDGTQIITNSTGVCTDGVHIYTGVSNVGIVAIDF